MTLQELVLIDTHSLKSQANLFSHIKLLTNETVNEWASVILCYLWTELG